MDVPVESLRPHRPRPVLTMADMLMHPGPTGLDRGTPHPDRDQPGHVWPSSGMSHGNTGSGRMQGQPAAPGGQAMDHAAMGRGSMGPSSTSAGTMDHAAMGHGTPAATSTGGTQAHAGHGGMAMAD